MLPVEVDGDLVFDDSDVARVRLIAELRNDLGVNEDAIPVVLRLLDQVRNESFEYSDFLVNIFGDAAVVKSRLSQVARVGDQPWNETFMLTDVWVRRNGRWQVVARHSSTPPTKAFTDERSRAASPRAIR